MVSISIYALSVNEYKGGKLVSTITRDAQVLVLASTCCNQSLPISLTSFTCDIDGCTVVLRWTTASEINNDHFIVMKSDDAMRFVQLKIITGSGNTSTERQYSIVDDNPFDGNNYYRLDQYDYDGAHTSSSMICALIKKDRRTIEWNILGQRIRQ